MVIEPLPGLSSCAGSLRVTPPGHSQHGARLLAAPIAGQRGGNGAGLGGAPDLLIMAARQGCRAEVTAARRGGGAAGGAI